MQLNKVFEIFFEKAFPTNPAILKIKWSIQFESFQSLETEWFICVQAEKLHILTYSCTL